MAGRTSGKRGAKRRSRKDSLAGVLVISGAIVFASLVLSRSLRKVEATHLEAGPILGQFDTVEIPVPAYPVPAGTKLADVPLVRVAFPSHQIPRSAVMEIEPHLHSVAAVALPARLPIFVDNLSQSGGSVNPVIERIPDSMRAITVRVNATSAVEGWAGTGAFVDVLLITRERASVVAEKVKILSAERSIDPIQGSDSPSVPSTITLLVSQDQALAINAAEQAGKLSFALRSNQDEGSWHSPDFTTDRLKGSPVPASEKKVGGYVSFGGSKDTYVLIEGRWVKSERQIGSSFIDSNNAE